MKMYLVQLERDNEIWGYVGIFSNMEEATHVAEKYIKGTHYGYYIKEMELDEWCFPRCQE